MSLRGHGMVSYTDHVHLPILSSEKEISLLLVETISQELQSLPYKPELMELLCEHNEDYLPSNSVQTLIIPVKPSSFTDLLTERVGQQILLMRHVMSLQQIYEKDNFNMSVSSKLITFLTSLLFRQFPHELLQPLSYDEVEVAQCFLKIIAQMEIFLQIIMMVVVLWVVAAYFHEL